MSKRPRKPAAPKTEGGDLPDLPPMVTFEHSMNRMFTGSRKRRGDDHKFEAQDLAYQAMEAADAGRLERAVDLALQAVQLHADCVDALVLLTQAGSDSRAQMTERMAQAVAAGERDLGSGFFKKERGYFWGLLETRPYMRARAYLAQLLAEDGRRDEAIGHYERMLELNPNDNQGLRYPLLGLYLDAGRLDSVARLFTQYPDEGSAVFNWARVLERHLVGDEPGATKALAGARACNRHVVPLLTGRKRMPRRMPGYYTRGEESEAVMCVDAIGAAWRQLPAALAWLAAQSK